MADQEIIPANNVSADEDTRTRKTVRLRSIAPEVSAASAAAAPAPAAPAPAAAAPAPVADGDDTMTRKTVKLKPLRPTAPVPAPAVPKAAAAPAPAIAAHAAADAAGNNSITPLFQFYMCAKTVLPGGPFWCFCGSAGDRMCIFEYFFQKSPVLAPKP